MCGPVFLLLSFVALFQITFGGAKAAPAATFWDSLEHRKRAAEDLWNELAEGTEKAENHDHWERIVRRSARYWYDPYYSDDALHIVNVQEYYRQILEEEEWSDSQLEQELARFLQPWKYADIQNGESYKPDMQKRIPGRYIVLLDSSANENILDKTIAILQHAHAESKGRLRADHITPMRNLGVGFTATMNSKTVQLVSHVQAYS